MSSKSRRLFLGSMGLGLATWLFNIRPKGDEYSIRREVIFPHAMDEAEFLKLTAPSNNYPAIKNLNRRMTEAGIMLSTKCVFKKDRAYFEHTFADRESYQFWLESIDQSWFDLARFEADGFRVKLYSLG